MRSQEAVILYDRIVPNIAAGRYDHIIPDLSKGLNDTAFIDKTIVTDDQSGPGGTLRANVIYQLIPLCFRLIILFRS